MARNKKSLHLDRENKKFLGVCAGIADYLGVESWTVRLVFIISVCFGAWFLIPLYFVAWFLLDDAKGSVKERFAENHTVRHLKNVDYRKPLYRNKRDGRFLGVCAGVADYLEVNVSVVRIMTFVMFFLSGSIVSIAYFGAYFILDEKPEGEPYVSSKGESKPLDPVDEALEEQARAAHASIKHCARKFSVLQQRLVRMEAYVTSPQFKLYREFKNM